MQGQRGGSVPGLVALAQVIDDIDGAPHPEDCPDEGAETVPVPAPDAAAEAWETDDRGDQRAGHARGPPAGGGLLDMDASVGFGQQCPGKAVQEYPDAGEHRQDDQDAADNQRVDAEPLGDAAGDAADPALAPAVDSVAADPVEEVLWLGAGQRRHRPVVGRWWRCSRAGRTTRRIEGRCLGQRPAGRRGAGGSHRAPRARCPEARRRDGRRGRSEGSWPSAGGGVCGFILRSFRFRASSSIGEDPELSLSRPRLGPKTRPGNPEACLD